MKIERIKMELRYLQILVGVLIAIASPFMGWVVVNFLMLGKFLLIISLSSLIFLLAIIFVMHYRIFELLNKIGYES